MELSADINDLLDIAHKQAGRVYREQSGYYDLDELRAEAALGLVVVLPDYRPERGGLAAFVACRVYFHLRDWVRRQSWIPARGVEAKAVAVGEREARRFVSIEEVIDGTEGQRWSEVLEQRPEEPPLYDPDELALLRQRASRLRTHRRRTVIAGMLAGETRNDLARRMGLTTDHFAIVYKGALAELQDRYGVQARAS